MISSESLALDYLEPADLKYLLAAKDTTTKRFGRLAAQAIWYRDLIERERLSRRFWPSGTTDLGGYPSISHRVNS
jgi:hypothetical protein